MQVRRYFLLAGDGEGHQRRAGGRRFDVFEKHVGQLVRRDHRQAIFLALNDLSNKPWSR